jgi:hypothetical protein
MGVTNDDSLLGKSDAHKLLTQKDLGWVDAADHGGHPWPCACIMKVATGLAKAMGEALQQSCRAALGNSIGDPLIEFPALCDLSLTR